MSALMTTSPTEPIVFAARLMCCQENLENAAIPRTADRTLMPVRTIDRAPKNRNQNNRRAENPEPELLAGHKRPHRASLRPLQAQAAKQKNLVRRRLQLRARQPPTGRRRDRYLREPVLSPPTDPQPIGPPQPGKRVSTRIDRYRGGLRQPAGHHGRPDPTNRP